MITKKTSRIIQAGLDIFPAERWVFFEHIFNRVARSQELQYGLRRNARSAHNRSAIADFRIDNNSINHVVRVASIRAYSKDKTFVRQALISRH